MLTESTMFRAKTAALKRTATTRNIPKKLKLVNVLMKIKHV
jgi:hypothetical protein